MNWLVPLADKLGVPPKKLLIIGSLGLVLIVVCIVQWYRMTPPAITLDTELTEAAYVPEPNAADGSDSSQSAAQLETATPPFFPPMEATAQGGFSGPVHRDQASASAATQQVPVGRVVRFDPFEAIEISAEDEERLSSEAENSDLVDNAAQPAPEDVARDLPVVVDQIILGPQGATARIGSTWVHPGDQWNGFIVKEIREDGVVLALE